MMTHHKTAGALFLAGAWTALLLPLRLHRGDQGTPHRVAVRAVARPALRAA